MADAGSCPAREGEGSVGGAIPHRDRGVEPNCEWVALDFNALRALGESATGLPDVSLEALRDVFDRRSTSWRMR
jgi:hypothetical protein